MNQNSMGWTALNLLECVLTLYPANADGTPNLDAPVWSGVPAQNLRVADRWIKMETRPTGAAYPRKRPLLPQFEISIERVWALYATNLNGIIPDENIYILDLVWSEENWDGGAAAWHRETFYGVTISDRNRASQNVDGGFIEELVFDAQYYVLSSGRGTAPPIAAALPMQVVYVDANGVAVPLYNYNPADHTFTETRSGIAETRATITLSATGNPLQIVFNEPSRGSVPVFWLDSAGTTWTFNLVNGAPPPGVARLDFYIGSNRVASLDAKGTFFAGAFSGNPQAGVSGNRFQLFAGNTTVVMTIDSSGARATAWHLFSPLDVTGGQLKCWTRIENLAALNDGDRVTTWPDESGGSGGLAAAQASGTESIVWNFDTPNPAQPVLTIPGNFTFADFSRGNNDGSSPTMFSNDSPSGGYAFASGNNNAALDAVSGPLQPASSSYFTTAITLAATMKQSFVFTGLSFGSRCTSSGPTTLSLYGSLDGFNTSQLLAQVAAQTDGVWRLVTFPAFSMQVNPGQMLTFRIYGSGGTGAASSGNWRVDDFTLNLQTLAYPLPATPSYAAQANLNPVTHETIPGNQPAVLLSAGSALATPFAIIESGAFYAFVVACPLAYSPTGGLLSDNDDTFLGSSPFDYLLAFDAGKLQVNFWVENSDSVIVRESAESSSTFAPGWYLLEQGSNAANLTGLVNGVPVAGVAFTSNPPSYELLPIQLGSATNGLAAYVKAVLFFTGAPTEEEKFWLRLFLNNAYQIY